MIAKLKIAVVCLSVALGGIASSGLTQAPEDTRSLDGRVRAFLEGRRGTWTAMNVPWSDGRALYDLIIKHNYTKALEIGTSTGHSGIWIAWALSKTGGKLITIEIDERRYRTALANFDEVGLSEYIDAQLADAHDLVPQLGGPFDFVFSDADKRWYTNYLKALLPKLEVGGCFTAHNVSSQRMRGIKEFLNYLSRVPNLDTTIQRSSPAGLSISYKTAE